MTHDGIRAGRSLTAGPYSVREMAYTAGLRQSRHAHDHMGVTLVIAGSIRECAGSGEEFGTALSVVVKPAGVEHTDDVGPHGARTLQIAFDPVMTGALCDGTRGLETWRWLHADGVVAAMLSLLRLTRCPRPCEADVEEHVIDAVAALATDRQPMCTAPVWLRRVKRTIDDGADCASVRELAREAGVHEVSLSRAFRRCFGCTMSEYRRRCRLRRAAPAIAAGSQHLSRVAHAAGYADHAHLCRDFRRATGLTPSLYRDLAQAG